MVCMLFCPCSKRTGALIVGIADLVAGSAALSAVCFLLYIISNEMNKLQDDYSAEYNERFQVLSGCKARISNFNLYLHAIINFKVFPAIVTVITGIFAVFAVSHKNDCCAIVSILLTVIMVFVCGGVLLILYIVRIEFPFLIPLIIGTLMHMFFTFVLLSFRTNELKLQHVV